MMLKLDLSAFKTKALHVCMWFCAACLVTANSAKGEEPIEVTHNVLHYPPYWVVDGNNISGYHYDLAKRIYQEAGLKPNFVVMPYARIEAIKNNPTTQIISYGSAKAESEQLLFPLPATFIALYAYSIKSAPPVNIEDYTEQRIALKRGFPLGQFTPFITDSKYFTVELATVDAAIQLMLFDRVDFVVTLSDSFDAAVEKYLVPDEAIYRTNLVKIYGHPIAINKAHKNAPLLFEKINEAYLKLVSQGKIIHASNQTLLTADFDKFINE